jgi:RimJ/RimL family protein N-acetyltransferase
MAMMQLPAVVLVIAENQWSVARPLERLGVVTNLGEAGDASVASIAEAIAQLRDDATRRAAQSQAGRRLVDGRGADRVVDVLLAIQGVLPQERLELRPVGWDDRVALWRLANDATVRQNSFSQGSIPLDAHFDWLRGKLESPASRMWVFDLHGVMVAQIRYDRVEPETAEVSFSVSAGFRRQGLGTRIVGQTSRMACEQLGVRRLRALVRPSNLASAKVFLKAGFRQVGAATIRGQDCRILEQTSLCRV